MTNLEKLRAAFPTEKVEGPIPEYPGARRVKYYIGPDGPGGAVIMVLELPDDKELVVKGLYGIHPMVSFYPTWDDFVAYTDLDSAIKAVKEYTDE